MKKVILLLIAVAALALLEPRSRAQIFSLIPPLSEISHQRTATRALEQIATGVQTTEAQTGRYPQSDAFRVWLVQAEFSAEDPWGSEYYLEVFPDSFIVGSPGPDSRRRTPDDIRLAERRVATAAGLGTAYTPPAPPPSSTKTRAMRAAEAASKGKGQ